MSDEMLAASYPYVFSVIVVVGLLINYFFSAPLNYIENGITVFMIAFFWQFIAMVGLYVIGCLILYGVFWVFMWIVTKVLNVIFKSGKV
tara:strand:+ start:147 stop:413 length:267 start_codon:yes stop_codon:yes gene_type:complete